RRLHRRLVERVALARRARAERALSRTRGHRAEPTALHASPRSGFAEAVRGDLDRSRSDSPSPPLRELPDAPPRRAERGHLACGHLLRTKPGLQLARAVADPARRRDARPAVFRRLERRRRAGLRLLDSRWRRGDVSGAVDAL